MKRKTRHAKTIIENKLYDTKKAEIISPTEDHRILFVTKKGNYFSCKTTDYDYMEHEENKTYSISETVYNDIRPEPLEYAMSNIGKYGKTYRGKGAKKKAQKQEAVYTSGYKGK